MTAASVLTLPGVAFESVSPPLDETLPRMDVCAFVGFASSGPFHVPVAVEDVDRFRDIFGPDPVLAHRRADGSSWHACLGGAVDAFFANGGRRAWVVRVGDDGPEGATTNHFVVPHLFAPGLDGGDWRLVSVRARCPGSWSDRLRAGASLRVSAARALDLDEAGVVVHPAVDVVPGDLIRLDLGADHEAWMVVGATTPLPEGLRVAFKAGVGWHVTPTDLASLAPLAVKRVTSSGLELPDAEGSLPKNEPVIVEADEAVLLLADPETEIRTGDVLSAVDSSLPDGSVTLVEVGDEATHHTESPPDDRRAFSIERSWNLEPVPALIGVSIPDDCVVEVVRIDIQVWQERGLQAEMTDVGLAEGHPRCLGSLPSDERLFSLVADFPRYGKDPEDGGESKPSDFMPASLTGLEREALDPRFPFARPETPMALFLPLGMSTVRSAEDAGPPPLDANAATPLERDGIADFGAHLFVDPDLARMGTDTLLAAAFDKAYVVRDTRRLQGIHAVLPLDEVTLLVVPDAGHPGWEKTLVQPPEPLTAPVLDQPMVADGEIDLWWSSVPEATGYELEQDTSPDFDDMPVARLTEEALLVIPFEPGCPERLHFRVRALRDEEQGPWSNFRSLMAVDGAFVVCEPDPESPPGGAPPEDFAEPGTVIGGEAAGPITAWMLLEPDPGPFPELEAIHSATIRLCAARADVVTILSLPREFRTSHAIEHIGRLTGDDPGSVILPAGVLPLGRGEPGPSSYAAFYHPWIVTGAATNDTAPPAISPEGPMAGIYAARALARGAWIAPANLPIAGALALEPHTTDADRLRAMAAGINPIAPDPRGFVAIGADTLSTVAALRPVNVRRLMILLRRLAIREGTTYVFHNNDAGFRRLVKMRFEALLSDMYRRGAFVGSTPEEAFQVATGDNINSAESVDLGRFVVEIRVAPSQPMKFITVRLVLTGQDVVAQVEQ